MSDPALKLVPSLPADAPAGLAWISQDEAIARTGLDRGSVRRLCHSKWVHAGTARKVPSLGGVETWEVHESADPRLVPENRPQVAAGGFRREQLSDKQRAVFDFRTGILDRWELVAAGAVAQRQNLIDARARFCELLKLENIEVSVRTLHRWESLRKRGPEYLVDGRSNATAQAERYKSDDPFLLEVARLWLRQSKPKKRTCYDHVARFVAPDQGWVVPCFKTADRYLEAIPEDTKVKMRGGETEYTNRCVPHAKRGYAHLRSNQWWCSDHHQFDVVVKTGERLDAKSGEMRPVFARPWITCWEDMRSRKIVGYTLFAHDPNQTTILHSLRAACLACGTPEHVLIDNGKDYDCYTLQGMTKWQRHKLKVDVDAPARGVLGALRVQVHHALPYKPRSKPVERFFGTVCTRFSKQFATYCGRNPVEKPEELPTRLAGGDAPTLADFAALFAAWVEADYHHRAHGGDGLDGEMTPAQAYERFLETKNVVPREDLELLIQRTSEPLAVGANGVTFGYLTYGRDQRDLLHPYFGRGKQVYLRVDPDDVSRATAWTTDDRIIGVLTANGTAAFGAIEDQEVRKVKSADKRARQITKEFYDLGPRRGATTLDLVGMQRVADAAAQKVAAEPLDPPAMKLVRTPLEGQVRQLEAIKNKQALRKAVGADPDAAPARGIYDDTDLTDARGASGDGAIRLYDAED